MLAALAALALAAPDTLTARDSAAIAAAARTVTPRPDSTGYRDELLVRGDTVVATVWLTNSKAQKVRVVRRAGQWQAVKSDTTVFVIVRQQHP